MKDLFPLFLLLLFTDACVDRLEFEAGDQGEAILVVDGLITDQPGPYTVKLLRSSSVDDILNFALPFNARSVTISDDAGNSEALKNQGEGQWATSADGIRGEVGRAYSLHIEGSDGTLYESTPDRMRPVAEIDSLYFQWESFLPISGPTVNGFRVFMDTKGAEGKESLMRWRFTGTYKVLTFPERHPFFGPCTSSRPDPLPCSGYVLSNVTSGILLNLPEVECTCCFCWVKDAEDKPRLTDNVIVTDGTFRKIDLGFVPFDALRFRFLKYMVRVEQMSLTREAFDFWRIIKDQKEGINSLFQPAFGKVRTNVFSSNSSKQAVGLFYTASIRDKVLFITNADAPIPVPEFDVSSCNFGDACNRVFPNSSTLPPPEWN